MTYNEFMNQSKNLIYITGTKPYLRTATKIFPKVKMSELGKYVNRVGSAIVIINEWQRDKRVKTLETLGCTIVNERHTGIDELSLYITR